MNGNISEVKQRLKKISPSIKILSKEYKNNKSPLKCKCLKCKHVWSPSWNSLSKGQGCPECSIERTKLTHLEVQVRLKKINPKIKIIGKYKDSKSPLKCKCLECKNTWNPIWADLGQGHGCPRCVGSNRLTLLDVKRKLKKTNPNIKIIGKYKGSMLPIKCKCLECKHIWSPSWNSLSQGQGCPKCYVEEKKLTQLEIKGRLKKINPKIKIMGEYKNNYSPLKCKCLECKNTWNPIWASLSRGCGCPRCNSQFGKSEEEARKVIEKLTGRKFPKANPSDVPFLHGLYLDGYCPNLKSKKHPMGTAFEFQDYSHYSPSHYTKFSKKEFIKLKRRDYRKKIQCYRHGVKLICIPYRIKDVEEYLTGRVSRGSGLRFSS